MLVINGLGIASDGGILLVTLPLECFGFDCQRASGRIAGGIFLKDVARRVEFNIRGAEAGDSFFSAIFRRAKVDEEDLVFLGVDDVSQLFLEFNFVGKAQVAFEYGVLEVVAVVATGFVNLAQAFGVADVVGDDVGGKHGLAGG